jgi:hypothetical protein
MSGAQSYIVRLLRNVESRLGDHGHHAEASRVGKIVQKLAQADDIHEELNNLYSVDGCDQVALRLMWLLSVAEKGEVGFENGVLDYQASVVSDLVIQAVDGRLATNEPKPLSEQLDDLFVSLHKFGKVIEELKREAFQDAEFKGIQDNQLFKILSELASLKESAKVAGRDEVVEFAEACAQFVQYALDGSIFADVRVANVLDNANLTLQTVFEAVGVEDNDSLLSTIELLKRPGDLLDKRE